jgi:hypothetical protein
MRQCESHGFRHELCKVSADTLHSDYTATPEKQAEQVKSIYPVVDGQKAEKQPTPPRSAAPRSEEDLLSMGDEAQPASDNKAAADAGQVDLVDFGQNEEASKPTQPKAESTPTKSSDEIADLLSSTGKPAQGPLLDFTQDMKKGLPSDKSQPSQDLLG